MPVPFLHSAQAAGSQRAFLDWEWLSRNERGPAELTHMQNDAHSKSWSAGVLCTPEHPYHKSDKQQDSALPWELYVFLNYFIGLFERNLRKILCQRVPLRIVDTSGPPIWNTPEIGALTPSSGFGSKGPPLLSLASLQI